MLLLSLLYSLIILGNLVENVKAVPNVVLIMADDLGIGSLETVQAKRLGNFVDAAKDANRDPTRTVNIEKLSRQGMGFDRVYADSPICSASRYALLTGIPVGSKYSRVRGNTAQGVDHELGKNGEITFAQTLKKKGYHTAMFGKWGFVDDPSKCGFDYYLGTKSHIDSHRYFAETLSEDTGDGVSRTAIYTPKNRGVNNGEEEQKRCNLKDDACDYVPQVLHEQALGWIDGAVAPFFLYIPSLIPHDGGKLEGKEGNILPVPSRQGPDNCPSCIDYSNKPLYTDRMKNLGSSISNYFDRQVQEVVNALKEKGVFENTLLIVLSDNGPTVSIAPEDDWHLLLDNPMNTNGDLRGYKRQLFEGGTRVPNLFIWPEKIKTNTGIVGKHVWQLSDLAPTLAQLAGVKTMPAQFSGISFADALGNPSGVNPKQHQFIYNEICTEDLGIIGEHSNCDISIVQGPELNFRTEWTSRKNMNYTINKSGGYVKRNGNLSENYLTKGSYKPVIHDIVNDHSETKDVYTPVLFQDAMNAVLQFRIVPENKTIPVSPGEDEQVPERDNGRSDQTDETPGNRDPGPSPSPPEDPPGENREGPPDKPQPPPDDKPEVPDRGTTDDSEGNDKPAEVPADKDDNTEQKPESSAGEDTTNDSGGKVVKTSITLGCLMLNAIW